MLGLETPCFVLIPNPQNDRMLLPGRVVELGDGTCAIELQEPVALEPQGDVSLFADVRGKFFQQAAKVIQKRQSDPEASLVTIDFARIGEPVSAESRGSYRVSVVSWNVPAQVGKNRSCQLADVSPEGIAVISGTQLTIGSMVEVVFTAEGCNINGQMKVQGCKTLPSGRLRYGLLAPDRKSAVRRELEKLSSAMQRAQLKRLSAAAA